MKKWTDGYLAMLKGMKARSEQQELLVLLSEKASRTKEEQRQMDVLLRAEKAKEQAKRAAKDAAALLGEHKEAERKARNHRLIQQGLLIDLAGLEGWDRGEILGGLLSMASATANREHRAGWKRQGDALLATKEAKNGS